MERVFSRSRVLRGRDSRRKCKNRPVSENRVKSDSRRLQTSLSSGLPLSSESFVWASHVQAKSVTPKLAEEGVRPDASEGGLFLQSPSGLDVADSALLDLPPRRIAQQSSRVASGLPLALVPSVPNEPKHFVYLLESTRNLDHHYTGPMSDVPARLAAHNDARSLHTAKHGPWKLLVAMEFTDRDRAARFERYLKTGSGRAFARRHF
jgi:predicted GIY-YIG superfamily endonuclease